jgi:hypothetical protein
VRQRDTCIVGLAVVIVSTADAIEFVGWLERIAALEDPALALQRYGIAPIDRPGEHTPLTTALAYRYVSHDG